MAWNRGLSARATHWAWLLGGLLFAISGIGLLVLINAGWFGRNPEEAPIIFRPPVDPLARNFVYFFAIGPRWREVLFRACSISIVSSEGRASPC